MISCALAGCGGTNGSHAALSRPPAASSTSAPRSTPVTSPVTPTTAVAPTSPPTILATPAATRGPASAPDVFAEVIGGAVKLMSAKTGAVIRTLVLAGGQSASRTGGRDFAVVGPSGRYVYYTDMGGAARVPITGGAVQQLPSPPGTSGARVVRAVYADRSDTHLEETVGAADYAQPPRVVVTDVSARTTVELGPGEATGWDTSGTTAYVTTTAATTGATTTQVPDEAVTITGIPIAAPTTHRYRETMDSKAPGDDGACGPTSTATAIGPTGQIGWVLGGCSSQPSGRLAYNFRIGERYSLVQATFPSDDQAFFASSLQYTPSGTAVVLLTHQDCAGADIVALDRGNGNQIVDIPSGDRGCG